MIPEEIFKRRRNHNNTPESVLLIIANYIVFFASLTLFTSRNHVNWFFWVVLGCLALYNFFTIRRNREEYNRVTTIAYLGSLVVLVAVFFIFRGMP
jgi:cell division protein FtsW (lipid II flippase)